jgi:uncharacterized protein YuzE
MREEYCGKIAVERAIRGLPELVALSPHIWVDYDEEADVLYVSFRRPQQAKDSVMQDNIVYHYDGDQVVGVTVLECKASNANSLRQ